MGLMNAILALSARHLGIEDCEKPAYAQNLSLDRNDAVSYYYKTLQYSQKAMQYDTYKTSLDLLAISMIISSYEMLDGSSKDWEKHLEGVFWIQRSQVIHGDSGGLRQAVWWAWLCQDVWAAFREKRKPFTFWRTVKTLEDLDAPEIAARSVYNFCQVVGYCSKKEREEGHQHLAYRSMEAEMLMQRLEDWKKWLTFEFEPLPCVPGTQADDSDVFPPVWIQPAAYGKIASSFLPGVSLTNHVLSSCCNATLLLFPDSDLPRPPTRRRSRAVFKAATPAQTLLQNGLQYCRHSKGSSIEHHVFAVCFYR